MTERRFSVTPYRVVLFIATVFTLTSLIFLVDSNLFSQRREFQESDYIMTFYVAGHLAATGKKVAWVGGIPGAAGHGWDGQKP